MFSLSPRIYNSLNDTSSKKSYTFRKLYMSEWILPGLFDILTEENGLTLVKDTSKYKKWICNDYKKCDEIVFGKNTLSRHHDNSLYYCSKLFIMWSQETRTIKVQYKVLRKDAQTGIQDIFSRINDQND